MADRKTLQANEISGHTGAGPGYGVQRNYEVCKLIDTTTCIGCKACEVACVEWNDMPFQPTTFDNTYQTMPKTNWNFWNLIKFNEHQNPDGTIQWLMRKDQCMHCADPGCLAACPADGAIVKYSNGIVDFNQENCIGCEYCVSGCPFDIPRFNPMTKKVYKCTLCSDRVGQGLEPACIKACPTGCLKFGSKEDMKYIANQRAKQLKDNFGFENAGVYDPQSVGGTHVIYVLHDATDPERYGGLPKNPTIPWSYTVWKWLFKPVLGTFAVFGFLGVLAHYVTVGPRAAQPEPPQVVPPPKDSLGGPNAGGPKHG
ncbi:MAG: formate dehydrogenase subunit beta [Terriglobales bacterium]